MQKVSFEKAYYIKLGQRNKWASNSINTNRIRIGWPNQTIEDIKNGNWEKIRDELTMGDEGAVTRDLNSLKNIVSNEDILFVTFFDSKLYWCKAVKNSIDSDDISKFLKVNGAWSSKDISGQKEFFVNQISGKITKYQSFRATCCKIGAYYDEVGYLGRLINNEESEPYKNLLIKKNELNDLIISQIQVLHPKDFEILIDLIFRQGGWRRVSVLGETMEFFDLILEEGISGLKYGVQIKTKSTKLEFLNYVNEFKSKYSEDFDKFIFVVHSPDNALSQYVNESDEIELWNTSKIAELIVDFGLINWLLGKIRQ